MIRIHRDQPGIDLRRVIEPLASYICATDQPKAVLSKVFSALAAEVAQVNRAARAQVAAFGRPPAAKA